MYLAPLNYDRYFKKVFSNPAIAKAFLQDCLGVTMLEVIQMALPLAVGEHGLGAKTAVGYGYFQTEEQRT